MGKLRYKGYSGTVEYDESNHLLMGKVLGLKQALILYEGDSVETLKKDFEESVDDYLETCQAEGRPPEKPYNGKLLLRMTSQLHSDAVDKASSLGISLNEFINRAVAAAIS